MQISSIKRFILCAGLVVSTAQAGADSSAKPKKVIKNEAVREFVASIKSGKDFNWARFKELRVVDSSWPKGPIVIPYNVLGEVIFSSVCVEFVVLLLDLRSKTEEFITSHPEISAEDLAPIYVLRARTYKSMSLSDNVETIWSEDARNEIETLDDLKKTISLLLRACAAAGEMRHDIGLKFDVRDQLQHLINQYYARLPSFVDHLFTVMRDHQSLTCADKDTLYSLLFETVWPWNSTCTTEAVKQFITADMHKFHFGVEIVRPEEAAV